MTEAVILGTGMVPFGKYPERDLVGLAAEAAYLALKDSGITPDRVEMAFFASASAAPLLGDVTVGQNVFWEVGINRIPVINIENACTSGSTAAYLACRAVCSGQVEVALVVGAEKLFVRTMGLLNSGANEVDTLLGMVAPAGFAMRANRHIHEFGTTKKQLAMVAVKNRRHGTENPWAQFRKPVSLEEVLTSPMIVDPLTRLQCCPNADGAAAVVVAASSAIKDLRRSVRVNSAVYCTGSYESPQDLVCWETDYRTCQKAYEESGLGPKDLDVIECHDAFTIAEILHYEALGLCEPGRGGRMVEEGRTALGGEIPVNVSGGLLSRGHPIAATGLAQIQEIVTQLRGEAGIRQVEGARIGLAQCMGGDKAADSKSCTVIIMSSVA